MKYTKQDVFNTILKVAQGITGTPAPKYANLNSSIREIYYDMQMDSLDEIEMIMKIEKHYRITIPDEEVIKYRDKTLDEFCGFICTVIKSQHQNIELRKQALSSKLERLFQRTK